MSDLTATNCGCGGNMGRSGCGFGNNGILWILILLLLCGNNGNDDCGCGGGLFGGFGNGGSCECILCILLLLGCCGGGNGFC